MAQAKRTFVELSALFLLSLGVAGTGLSFEQQTPHPNGAAHAERATRAAERRQFTQAEEEWKKVLELDPHSPRALHNLGMVYYLERKYPEAEAALEEALKVEPSLASGRVLLGASLWRQGSLDRAVTELQLALRARLPEGAEKTARTALHGALFQQGNFARALEVLRPLATKYPRDVDLLYNLGQTHLQLAAEHFQRIALVDSDSYRVHQIVAESLARQGLYRDAIREYRQALERKPDLCGLHYQVGLLYWWNEANSAGEDAALAEFEAELNLNPFDGWSEYRLGQIYRKRQDAERAFAHFRRSVELQPTLVAARLALARDLQSRGKLDEAQAQLEAARKFEPDSPAVHFRLAQLYRQRGNEPAASEEMRRFQALQQQRQDVQRQLEQAVRSVGEEKTGAPDEQEQ